MTQHVQISKYKIKKIISKSKEVKEVKVLSQKIQKILKVAEGDY